MRIVVVEDEEIAADRLCRLTREILGERLVSIEAVPSLGEAARHLERNPVDLVFLDLDLNGRDGFELLRRAVAAPFQTIIVSARHDQALRAFEHGVADFVPKPYDLPRLARALERVTTREDSLRRRLKYLAIKRGDEIVPVAVGDVVYVRGADDYSELHCRDGSCHLHAKTLGALEQLLPPSFERVHRSYLVDTAAIESYAGGAGGRYRARLVTGEEIPVSRKRIRHLRARLG